MNTVVKEEDDREETEVKEDGMPTQEHLLQILGMSNNLVYNVNNFEELDAKAGGCWDGDTLANLGFTNIRLGSTGLGTNHEDQHQRVSFAAAEWRFQGVYGTDPLKAKKKIKTSPKLSDSTHISTIKVNEKPSLIKKCMKNMNSVVVIANASSRSAKTVIKKSEDNRYILDRWKLYLGSCATCHSFFDKGFLIKIKDGDMTLTVSCNAGTTLTNTSGWRWGA